MRASHIYVFVSLSKANEFKHPYIQLSIFNNQDFKLNFMKLILAGILIAMYIFVHECVSKCEMRLYKKKKWGDIFVEVGMS